VELSRSLLEGAVFIVGEVDVGDGDVAFKLRHARCARDRRHGRVADDPGQRYLCRGDTMRVRDLPERCDQNADAL
jgi:hypothetical protein